MAAPDLKATLHRYLRWERGELLARLDGLGERDVRWPMTPTGTNLLGIVKHVASVQLDYFGVVFDRPHDRPLPWFEPGAEPNADMWATADETREEILDLWAFSAEHSDATIEALDLDAPGVVPWWSPEKRDVTLGLVLVHVIAEVARHAGHADIVHETIDGTAGLGSGANTNLPPWDAEAWQAYRARVEQAAEQAAAREDTAP